MACDLLVETSALVAIMLREPGSDELVEVLEAYRDPATTPLAVFEAALVIGTRKGVSVSDALARIEGLLTASAIRVVPIEPAVASVAAMAADRFGKGRGHPAHLNVADCLAYAVAKHTGVPLLYIGEDFRRTDIHPALPAG